LDLAEGLIVVRPTLSPRRSLALKSVLRVSAVVTCAVLVLGCVGTAQATSPALGRYDLTSAPTTQWKLPGRLREVSGLATTRDGRLFGHDDERAVIYEIDYQEGAFVKAFSMGEPPAHADFEGVAVVDDRFYLVTSDGRLYESAEGEDDQRMLFNTYDTGVGRYCEVEGLTFEPSDRSMLVLCKQARAKALKDFVTVYRWSIDARRMAADSLIQIPLRDVTSQIDGKSFSPSGIERHPETGTYLVVAAREDAIAEFSPRGEVLGVFKLPDKIHRQVEGIALGRDGSLLLADEGGGGRARLSVYRPRSN